MNVCMASGRLVRDPELKSTASGMDVVNFTVAVRGEKKENGEYDTEFIDCVIFGGAARYLSAYCKKGDYVVTGGKLHTQRYEKDGEWRKKTEVICKTIESAGNRNNAECRIRNEELTTPPSPDGDISPCTGKADNPAGAAERKGKNMFTLQNYNAEVEEDEPE